MGRLIDADQEIEFLNEMKAEGALNDMRRFAKVILKEALTVEAIPKDQYEARLKADMVAMLTEIRLEIEELDSRAGYDGNGMPTFSTDYIRKKKVNELIQQKIDRLKEVEE